MIGREDGWIEGSVAPLGGKIRKNGAEAVNPS